MSPERNEKRKKIHSPKKPNSWIAMKHIREIQLLAWGPFYYFQLWFYSWVIICDQMHHVNVYFFFFFLATLKYLKRWNVTHPENEALKGPRNLRRPEAAGSLLVNLSFVSANWGGESCWTPLEMSFQMCVCVFVCTQRACSPALCRKS